MGDVFTMQVNEATGNVEGKFLTPASKKLSTSKGLVTWFIIGFQITPCGKQNLQQAGLEFISPVAPLQRFKWYLNGFMLLTAYFVALRHPEFFQLLSFRGTKLIWLHLTQHLAGNYKAMASFILLGREMWSGDALGMPSELRSLSTSEARVQIPSGHILHSHKSSVLLYASSNELHAENALLLFLQMINCPENSASFQRF